MLPVPVHVAEELTCTVLNNSFPAAPVKDSGPLAFVTPLPLIVPPLQSMVPLTSNVPVPASAPLLNVKLATLAAALSVAVPPLLIAASSPDPGTPLGFQLFAVNQSP